MESFPPASAQFQSFRQKVESHLWSFSAKTTKDDDIETALSNLSCLMRSSSSMRFSCKFSVIGFGFNVAIWWHRTHLIVVWRQLLQQLSDSVLVASTVGIRDFLFGNLREIQLHLKSSEKLRRWTRVETQGDGFQSGFPRIPYN